MTVTQDVSGTLPERVALVIRDRILALHAGYLPGDRLYPSRISADLGVSVTPIREAFQILANTGLVIIKPRLGVRVVNPTESEFVDLLIVQEEIDALALRLSSTQADTAGLRESLARSQAALDAGDATRCRELCRDFHRMLVSRSTNVALIRLYDNLLAQSQVLDIFYPRQLSDIGAAVREHRLVLASLESPNGQSVESALHDHWTGTRSRILRSVRERRSRRTPARGLLAEDALEPIALRP